VKKRSLLIPILSCLLFTNLNPQPALAVEETFYPTYDSYVNSAYPDDPRGSVTSLICGRISGGAIRWPILRFDLSSIPTNAIIESVNLSLVLYDSSGLIDLTIDAYLLDDNWNEDTATWNDSLDIYGDSVASLDVGHGIGNRYWELTSETIGSRWIENPSNNYGVILKGAYDGPDAFARSFRSKEYADDGVHPKLYVTYTLPDETPPDISDVSAQEITHNSAAIVWETDEEATSWGEYWKTEGFVTTAGQDEWTTNHRVTLWDLNPVTTYTFQVTSKDAEDNESTSDEHEFTTLTAPSSAETPEAGPGTVAETEPVVTAPETTKEKLGDEDKPALKDKDQKEATAEGEKTENETEKDESPLLLLIVAFVTGVSFVLLVVVIIYVFKQKKLSNKRKGVNT